MFRTAGLVLALAGCLAVWAAIAQTQEAAPPNKLSQADLEEMLGPIALYPDSLLANVLAASIYPDEVASAAKFVQNGGQAEDLSKQPWEPPVQAVAAVPEVISLLAQNMDWTTAIGQAYLVQPGDVTAAIQSLRAKATENGALQSNDQQTVVQDGSTVMIEPAQPDVVYVPQYDPQVVYVQHYDSGWGAVAASAISFGVGVAVGAAFDNIGYDWHGGGLCWGNWGGYRGDVNINRSAEFNRNVNVGDINVNNRPRPGNEGQRWTPDRDRLPNNGVPRTDKLNQFRGESGRQAMNNLHRPAALPAARPGGVTPPRLGGVTPPQQPLRKVSPPRVAAPVNRPNIPSARETSRTPTQRPTVSAPRASGSAPSAFNRGGASSAARNRGSASRGGSRPSGGGARAGGGRRSGGGGGRR